MVPLRKKKTAAVGLHISLKQQPLTTIATLVLVLRDGKRYNVDAGLAKR